MWKKDALLLENISNSLSLGDHRQNQSIDQSKDIAFSDLSLRVMNVLLIVNR